MKYSHINVGELVNDYTNYGSRYCKEKFSITGWSLYQILKKENIQITHKHGGKLYRNQKYLNVNADDFIAVKTKFHAYVLGLLWADGWLIHKKKKKEIRMELTYIDGKALETVFSQTGKWTTFFREKSEDRKARFGYVCHNAKWIDFLLENDYKIKSLTTPTKIWSTIPEEFKKYFLLGWIDGDGCFYMNEKNYRTEFCMGGTYEQDWSCLTEIFEQYGIASFIKRNKTNHGNSSVLRVFKRNDLLKMKNILYGNGYEFGLIRKYNKLCNIENYILSKRSLSVI